MRVHDFFIEHDDWEADDPTPTFDNDLISSLRAGPAPGRSDIEVAVPLARLVHEEFETFGTSGEQRLHLEEIRVALRALRAVLKRLSIDFRPEFVDYGSFRTYWIRNGAAGNYQARRDILNDLFNPLHDQLAAVEDEALASSLAKPITSHPRTGWAAVDEEIGELRRHFAGARTVQDYRAVGNDCVHLAEELSRQVYDVEKHLRDGEDEPSVAKTKMRIERYIEDAIPGSDNDVLRKLARASLEMGQAIKHRKEPTRRDAGISADAMILLANILRRLEEA